MPDGWQIVGINTYTEGYGGRFGDTGGGVLVEPYSDWIFQITGIPEPSCPLMLMLATLLILRRRRVPTVSRNA
ncbi:PEP-CTERM sorting domain-containing protein [bacterium]|nr:PEP-CTERM sorting domain-containing protein [bacterium]